MRGIQGIMIINYNFQLWTAFKFLINIRNFLLKLYISFPQTNNSSIRSSMVIYSSYLKLKKKRDTIETH